MIIKSEKIISILASLLSLVIFPWPFNLALAAGASNFRIEILAYCGNSLKEMGEQCDGADLGGATCASQGFASGTLSCNVACALSTLSCVSAPSGGSGGGGGGGGGSSSSAPAPVTPVTSAIFNGRAYPRSTVTLLKDAQAVATTVADASAAFSLNLSGLSGGNYIFSLYSEDDKGNRSSLLTFPVGITAGATTQISNIFITPTIGVDKSTVKRGDNIAIFGRSAPNSEITISVNSEEEFFGKTKTDQNGVYLYNFDTSPLAPEQHFTRSKAALGGEISSFSKSVGFMVGDDNIEIEAPKAPIKSDFSGDGKVNLVDFSIAAYWNNRPSPPAAVDLNKDGKVNLVDFSIMAFYWTG